MGLSIKRYSNCFVVVNGNLSVIWHDGKKGKKYFGSWKSTYLDEGMKDGIGLEWLPSHYVYYGQFKENKKYGFGGKRKCDGNVTAKFWKNSQKD